MPRGWTRWFIVLALASVSSAAARADQSPLPNSCSEWHECQRLAVAAAERGEYETFHDLAWRAAQTGPRNDPALMYLLARAQSLSGRPHDALVMLERLAAARALPPDALSSEDFRRVRQLAGWADFESRIADASPPREFSMLPPGRERAPAAGAASTDAAPANAGTATAPAASSGPMPAAGPEVLSTAVLTAPAEAIRFRTPSFTPGGMAYDAVSERFLFGDRRGRKLIVVGDRSDHSVDLARAEASGFRDIAAIEIDAKRGDLWVASAGDGAGLLHKLQLISGRTLKTYPIDADGQPVRPADLAVASSGAVYLLDAGSGRVLVLRPGQAALEAVARLRDADPATIAVAEDEEAAYVAHGSGISRVAVHGGHVAPVSVPAKSALGRIECLRWYRRSLIAVEQVDGSRRVVRLALNDRGTAVTKATTIADHVSADGRISAAISRDDLVYVVGGSQADPPAPEEVVAYRIRLR